MMRVLAWVLSAGLMVGVGRGQAVPPAATVPILMLSDIHFDPFRDPAKVPRLAAAPVAEWEKILAAPASPGRLERYQALEAECKAKGEDSDFDLLRASLKAEKSALPNPRFVTISGDLLVHQFDCRYASAMKSDKGFADFAEKTASFVIESVEAEFPKSPVFVGMGNNDSSCGDYKMDPRDRYFAGTAAAIGKGMLAAPEAADARKDYEADGFYHAMLPGMATPTRLLVLDDIFLSKSYTTCAGKTDPAGATQMMAWLTAQLAQARQNGEKVWVMGHIPPGVNVYATLRKGDPCSGKAETFLGKVGKQTLGGVIGGASDVVTLAIFGHTHMDELRVLKADDSDAIGVPMKGVSSVTPVNGNLPSFTVAQIDPGTSTMADYSVFTSPTKSGDGAWKRAYRFDETYAVAGFTGATLKSLVKGFRADSAAETPASGAYERYFDAGFPISPLVLGWEPYVCGIDHLGVDSFKACACAGPATVP